MQVHRYGRIALFFVAGLAAGVSAEPDSWDQRLDGLGVYVTEAEVSAGTWYWRLVSAQYEDEIEAAGTHHVFYKALDADGDPVEGQKIWQAWPTGNPDNAVSDQTKGAFDQYWGNMAMFGGSWCPPWPEGGHGPYGAYVDGPGDEVWGMGMPCNRHVSFRLTWQWTQRTGGGSPAISLNPPALAPQALKGESPPGDTFTVRNSGTGILTYTITVDAPWLSVSPAGGTSTGEADTIAVTYTSDGLAPGTYTAAITVSDPEAANSPQTVPVTLTITAGWNLISNGDFSAGLSGWLLWTERGQVTAAVSDGQLHLHGESFNGGVWQQFATGGPGTVVPVSGYWASSPTEAATQWAEVLIINGSRFPRDGHDIVGGEDDVVLIYKNDTWATPGGWAGDMAGTAPVENAGAFVAADSVASIVLKCGNAGGAETGTHFDDIILGSEGTHFMRGDTNADGRVDISDPIALLMHLFRAPTTLPCEDAADANDDGALDLADAIAALSFLFANGPALLPVCGPDPTEDTLTCDAYTACRPSRSLPPGAKGM